MNGKKSFKNKTCPQLKFFLDFRLKDSLLWNNFVIKKLNKCLKSLKKFFESKSNFH